MKDLCPGCACWVEDGWSYCMQCGTARAPPRRRSPTPSYAPSSDDVYGNTSATRRLKQVSTPPKERGKRKLLRRRQSSDEVRHQLQQWRARLKAQEDLLHHLERSNTVSHQAAATRTASELRRVVQDGRALVKTWSQKDALATLMPNETRRRKGRRKLPAVRASADNPTCSPGVPTSKREEELVNAVSCSYARTSIAKDELTLSGEKRPSDSSSGIPSKNRPLDFPAAPDPAHDANYVVPTGGGGLPPRKGGSALGIDESSSHGIAGAGIPAADSNGWFWGANGPAIGGNADPTNSSPGQGAMGAFWRKAKVGGATALDPHIAFPAARHTPTIISMKHRESPGQGPSRPVPRHASSQSTAKISAVDDHHRYRPQSNRYSSGTFIGVASTKAAVRSASNRATELSRLLAEGNNPPREECLAKAESAVRAAQLAVSCSNEKMFELEMMVGTTGGGGGGGGSGGNDAELCGKEKHVATKSGVEGMGADVAPEDNCSEHGERTIVTTSLMLHIAQLTKQMQLAQSLQAASLAARARLTRRFAREDEATTILQARVRGYVVRSQGIFRKKGAETNRRISQPSAQSDVTALSTANEETDYFAANCSMVALFSPNNHGEEEEAVPAWEGEEWWTLAVEESADEIGDRENRLLGGIVKLQAVVRSRQARSRTFATVNARFVEYFDEQYQYPFYVCTETNCSQWNRPFGFGVSLVCRDLVAEEEENLQGGDEDGSHNDATPKEVEAAISDDECAQAAVVIQCAVRAAKARARLAERIVSDSF